MQAVLNLRFRLENDAATKAVLSLVLDLAVGLAVIGFAYC